MGFSRLASLADNPVYWNAYKKNLINSSVFSFWLSSKMGANGGELYLGGLNSNRYTGAITWLPVTSAAYWSVRLDGVQAGSNSLSGVGTRVILDTGTSLIIGPTRPIGDIHRRLGATYSSLYGLFQVSCSRITTMPNITFRLAGRSFVLRPSEYILRFDSLCFSGFAAGDFRNDEGQVTWILGDVFLRPWYSVHDMEGRRIGLAKSL